MNTHHVSGLFALSLFAAAGCKTSVIGAVTEGETTCATSATSTEPPRVGADRQVRDMTLEEARAWCSRYVSERYPLATQNPPPERPPVDFQGPRYPEYIEGYACSACYRFVPGGLYAMQPTVDDCVTNLCHAPCEATITALDDCVDTFFDGATFCSATVGGGCDPFLSAAHCAETVIHEVALQPPPDPYGTTPFQPEVCALRLGLECGD